MKRTRLWSVLLPCLLMAVLLFLVQPAKAQSTPSFEYGMTEGGIEIFRADGVTGQLTIPSTWNGEKVVALGDSAFYGQQGITSLVISEGITKIDAYAFCECGDLTAVTLPDSLKILSYGSFSDCPQLAFTVYKNGKYLGNAGNPYLALVAPVSDTADVTVHKDTKVICEGFAYLQGVKLSVEAGNACFSADSAGVLYNKDKTVLLWTPAHLSGSYTVPNGVVEICDSAFSRSKKLTEITVADSVKIIGSYAFSGLSELKTLTLGDQLEYIGSYALSYCDALTYTSYENGKYLGSAKNPHLLLVDVVDSAATEFRFHENTKVIGPGAFNGCSALTELTVPDSIVGIGDNAFWHCSALTKLTVGKGVRNIGSRLTYSCDQLTQIVVDSGNTVYSSHNGVLLNKDETLLLQAPGGIADAYTVPDSVIRIEAEAFFLCDKLTGITFGKGLREIGEHAFNGCEKLTELVIPGNVQILEGYAFYECIGMRAVTLGEGVTTVKDRAFYCCSMLESVMLPDSLTAIGWEAFGGSDKLTTVTIPKNVTRLGEDAFTGCPALTQILVAKENPNYSSVNGVLYDKKVTCLIQAPGGLTHCVVPKSVTTIGAGAFFECRKLDYVILPEGLTTIERGAFCDTSLGKLLIPASVTQLGETAFRDLSKIRFLGDVPKGIGRFKPIESGSYSKPTIYYPAGNAAWEDEEARKELCNKANWEAAAEYAVTQGEDTVITPESPAITLGTDQDSFQFIGVFLDGEWVEPANYIMTGNTVITLTEAYQKSLRSGTHRLTLAFAGGEASLLLTMEKKNLVGDLDGKDDVAVDDAIYLLQHVLMPGQFPVAQFVDFDGSGAVGVDDAIYLLQHVLMPEQFPIHI